MKDDLREVVIKSLWQVFRENTQGAADNIDDGATWQRVLVSSFADAAIAAARPVIEREVLQGNMAALVIGYFATCCCGGGNVTSQAIRSATR